MTKWKLTFEGDTIDDRYDYEIISHWSEMYSALVNTREVIRSRTKHGENISDQEDKFHDELYEALNVKGLDI